MVDREELLDGLRIELDALESAEDMYIHSPHICIVKNGEFDERVYIDYMLGVVRDRIAILENSKDKTVSKNFEIKCSKNMEHIFEYYCQPDKCEEMGGKRCGSCSEYDEQCSENEDMKFSNSIYDEEDSAKIRIACKQLFGRLIDLYDRQVELESEISSHTTDCKFREALRIEYNDVCEHISETLDSIQYIIEEKLGLFELDIKIYNQLFYRFMELQNKRLDYVRELENCETNDCSDFYDGEITYLEGELYELSEVIEELLVQ